MATPPRPVFAGQTVFITWRAVNRCFRFVPTTKNTDTIWYALAYAAEKFDIQLHDICVLSNHGHAVLTCKEANIPEFMELFGSLTARSLNAIIGINGSVIEKGYSSLAPQDGKRLLEHCAYSLANPCAADLVARARHWKGVTTARMRYGETVTIRKPQCGIWAPPKEGRKPKSKRRKQRDARCKARRGRSKLPDTVKFRLTRPPVRAELSDDELRDLVLSQVAEREQTAEAQRAKRGAKVMGMKRVRQQFWGSMPGKEDLFARNPTVSSSSRWDRREALERRYDFISAYKHARERWLQGDAEVVFPQGTWLLHRRFGVRCEGDGCPLQG